MATPDRMRAMTMTAPCRLRARRPETGSIAPDPISKRHRPVRHRFHFDRMGQHAGDLRSHGRGHRAALDEGTKRGRRLDHGGIFHAPLLDSDPQSARHIEGKNRRTFPGNPAFDWPRQCARPLTWKRSARAPSGWIAMSCRPTAARARRRSRAVLWRCRWPCEI